MTAVRTAVAADEVLTRSLTKCALTKNEFDEKYPSVVTLKDPTEDHVSLSSDTKTVKTIVVAAVGLMTTPMTRTASASPTGNLKESTAWLVVIEASSNAVMEAVESSGIGKGPAAPSKRHPTQNGVELQQLSSGKGNSVSWAV